MSCEYHDLAPLHPLDAGVSNLLRRAILKKIALLAAFVLISTLFGCSGNDKDRATASEGSMPNLPNEAAGAEGASGDANAAQPQSLHPEANGGAGLRASTPYAGGGAVSQNINPGPFLNAAETHPAPQTSAPTVGLTARADGTMYGRNDQPAAGIGPGIVGSGGGASSGNPPANARTGGKPAPDQSRKTQPSK